MYEKTPIVWFHKRIEKSNKFCPYCGKFFGSEWQKNSNKEHLIGRKFIPYIYSKENIDFNFIFRSCVRCNNVKSELERHVSSISLFNCKERRSDHSLNEIAENKGKKDSHPDYKGIKIEDSKPKIALKSNDTNFNVSLNLSAPPQVNEDYAKILSKMQIQGMFALLQNIEYLNSDNFRILPIDEIQVLKISPVTDWGNAKLIEIYNRIKDWNVIAGINTFNGFFKLIIKNLDDKSREWVWAIEWNKYFRIIGSIYSKDDTPEVFRNLPELNEHIISKNDEQTLSFYKETGLQPKDDILFDYQ